MLSLIVGLGNPGKTYQNTRHNIGFLAIDRLAQKHGIELKKEEKLKGSAGKGKIGEDSVILLEPHTFMNLSGEAVAKTLNYYKIELSRLLIITDDVDLPFGQLRIKINSGAGSHNGLKSVEGSLGTNRYPRLRVGIGDREQGELADYVLSNFSKREEELIPGVLDRIVQAVEIWLDKGLTSAMNFANQNSSTPSIGEKNDKKDQ